MEIMRVCLNCGRDLERRAIFCDICGQPQRSGQAFSTQTGWSPRSRFRITGKIAALLAMIVIMPTVVWFLLAVVLPAK